MVMVMTFYSFLKKYKWKEIHRCPGRYTLSGEYNIKIQELSGTTEIPDIYYSEQVQDPFYIIPLIDGGIISYIKSDGVLIHTLNTLEGFIRKLKDLGIEVDDKGNI